MNKTLKNIIKVTIFLGIGIVLFLLVYKDIEIEMVISELKKVNYWWFVPFAVVSGLSNVSRTIRWQMLIKSYGGNAGFVNTFFATLIGYFANLALPRVGEITRCGIVSKYEKQEFSKVLGTMVSERLVDVIMLFLVIIFAFIIQKEVLLNFIRENPELQANAQKLLSPEMLAAFIIAGALGVILLMLLLKGKFEKNKILNKLTLFIKSFWIGLISIRNVKSFPLFIAHSVFIFIMYFLMIYLAFPAFHELQGLNMLAALSIFVAATFGMIAPAPNGVGAYHFMVSQTLVLYGVSIEKALVFALVIHSFQTLLIIIGGVLSLIALPIYNNKFNKSY